MAYQLKIKTFSNRIRDPDVRHGESSFAETVSFALTQETVKMIFKPQVGMIRETETYTDEEPKRTNDLKEVLMQVLRKVRRNKRGGSTIIVVRLNILTVIVMNPRNILDPLLRKGKTSP